MKKIWLKLRLLFVGFFIGMKKTEDDMLHQSGIDVNVGSGVNQQVSDKSVAKALLRGELTQEVIDLRYRTYAVAREASHYNYFSPTLAKKKTGQNNKFVKVENEDNREIITIQENFTQVETLEDFFSNQELYDKKYKKPARYHINFEREFIPRYKLEEFAKKVVVKKSDNENQAILDVYVSIYPDDKVFASKAFIHEIEKVKDHGLRSDCLDIKLLEFETLKAYNLDDMIHFAFGDLKLEKIIKYDGNYVIRFISDIIDGGSDLTEQFYSEQMAKKYENKEKKESVIQFDPKAHIKVYKCANCGKEVTYDAQAIDKLEASDQHTDGSTTEYLDYEMSAHVFGKMLCKDCIREEQEKLYQKLNK